MVNCRYRQNHHQRNMQYYCDADSANTTLYQFHCRMGDLGCRHIFITGIRPRSRSPEFVAAEFQPLAVEQYKKENRRYQRSVEP